MLGFHLQNLLIYDWVGLGCDLNVSFFKSFPGGPNVWPWLKTTNLTAGKRKVGCKGNRKYHAEKQENQAGRRRLSCAKCCCGRAEGRGVDSVWREVFLEVTGLNLEGSFWRGSGQRSMAGNPGLSKVVGRQEVQPGQKVGQCGDVRQCCRGVLQGA